MKKKALLVGINNYKYVSGLKGCVNDVKNMNHVLQTYFGFKLENIRQIIDESVTRNQLMLRLRWLIQGAIPGDILVFHFSGHGSQILDRGRCDELNDQKDELLCLYDINFRDVHSFLIDDDFGKILNRIPKGVNISIILDSCHSGTATRGLTSITPEMVSQTSYLQYRYIAPPVDINLREKVYLKPTRRFAKQNGADIPINHLLLAACLDKESAADAYINGDYNGAFTYNLCKLIRDTNGNITYRELINRTNKNLLHNQFAQTPQLEGSEEFKDKLLFSSFSMPTLTCIYGHPVVVPQEDPQKFAPQEHLEETFGESRSIIIKKRTIQPLAQGIILGETSEFNGIVVVDKRPSPQSRELMAESASAIMGGIEDGGFEVASVLEFQPAEQRAVLSDEQLPPIPIEVECGEDEKVVLLTEEDGVWSWCFPEEKLSYGVGLRGYNTRSERVRFNLPLITQGITTRGIYSKLIYVMKFKWLKDWIGELCEDAIFKLISTIEDKTVEEGFKRIECVNGQKVVTPFNDWGTLDGKKGLLLIHGTFSSIEGGFKDIPTETIVRWKQEYAAVLGFDHKTLSKTPKNNIEKMLSILPQNPNFYFDVISHSRGGLVLRSLVESCQTPLVKNGIMVGTPNGGTTLADPTRWDKMVNLLTTLFNFMGGSWIKIGVPLLGGIIKYLTSKLNKPEVIPGLWAQTPGGSFIAQLNETKEMNSTHYAAITSNFEPDKLFEGSILMNILDLTCDAFFGYPNDLVVNTNSMTMVDIGGPLQIPAERCYLFEPEEKVHHCIYFCNPKTIDAINGFLGGLSK